MNKYLIGYERHDNGSEGKRGRVLVERRRVLLKVGPLEVRVERSPVELPCLLGVLDRIVPTKVHARRVLGEEALPNVVEGLLGLR